MDESVIFKKHVAAAMPQRRWFIIIASLLMALILDLIAVYMYYWQPVKRNHKGDASESVVVNGSVASESVAATAPTVMTSVQGDLQPSVDFYLKSSNAQSGPAIDTSEPPVQLPLALPSKPALLVTNDEPKTRQDPPIFKECPPAVETLGLCSPEVKLEE